MTGAGDFERVALARAVNTPGRNRLVVEAYLQHAAGRRALVLTVDQDHAGALVGAFRERRLASYLLQTPWAWEGYRALSDDVRDGTGS
jgi:hypothetical protein